MLQYPLKEVVVIHQDPEALKDIESLQKYILEVSKLEKENRTPNHSNIYIVLCIHIALFCFVLFFGKLGRLICFYSCTVGGGIFLSLSRKGFPQPVILLLYCALISTI